MTASSLQVSKWLDHSTFALTLDTDGDCFAEADRELGVGGLGARCDVDADLLRFWIGDDLVKDRRPNEHRHCENQTSLAHPRRGLSWPFGALDPQHW